MISATGSRRTDGVPVPPTPLIGRSGETDFILSLLTRAGTRLITLSGPGGVGKTRLALEVAGDSRVASQFPDGVQLVHLAAIRDPELILPAIAQAIGVREAAGQALADLLQSELGPRALLLVLDNFEHLAAGAPLLADLLAAAPDVKALVTSRVRLNLRGEHDVPIRPLQLPTTAMDSSPDALGRTDAVQLFLARAREIRPDFALTAENSTAVAEICRRLDGLPLAIELAAARLSVLSPRVMLERMDRRLPLLTGGPRDLPDRQQTLRAAIAWSDDLLLPEQRSLFHRLAAFAGTWSLEAAEAICCGDAPVPAERGGIANSAPAPIIDPVHVIDNLAVLVDHSLVHQETGAAGAVRFQMLSTIREYALERLEGTRNADAVRERHAQFFLTLALSARMGLTGPMQATWLDRLEADHANLRLALEWLCEHGRNNDALRLAGSVWLFWFTHGHLSEGRDRLTSVLAMPRDQAAPDLLAIALAGAGALAEAQGDYAGAEALLDEALALARHHDDQRVLATALLLRGVVAFDLDDPHRTSTLCQESLTLARAMDDTWTAAVALTQLGLVALRAKDHAAATALLEEGLAGFKGMGNRWGVALITGNLGIVALDRGHLSQASDLLRESLTALQEMGDRWAVATLLDGPARVAVTLGQAARAARIFGATAALRERIGAPLKGPFRSGSAHNLALVRAALGEEEFAAAWAVGSAMTPEEAVAEAVAAIPAPPASPRPPQQDFRGTTSAPGLTARELDVLRLMIEGSTDREIADVLFIGHRTVATHVSNILGKFGVKSRAAAITYAHRNGLA